MVISLPLMPPTTGHSPSYSTALTTTLTRSLTVVRVMRASSAPSTTRIRRRPKSMGVWIGWTCLADL